MITTELLQLCVSCSSGRYLCLNPRTRGVWDGDTEEEGEVLTYMGNGGQLWVFFIDDFFECR